MAFIAPLERIVVGLVWNVEALHQKETAMRAFFKVAITAQGLRFRVLCLLLSSKSGDIWNERYY